MAYDPAQKKIIMFGGYTAYGRLDDTWEWDSGAFSRPGQVMQAAFAAAGTSSTPVWESAGVRFYAGGMGYQAGSPVSGINLKVWDRGMWKIVDSKNYGPGAPDLTSWSTGDPDLIGRLFFGARQTLNFAVVPVEDSGSGTAEVTVDYAEVTLRYTLP
jgi:hypothetical protein